MTFGLKCMLLDQSVFRKLKCKGHNSIVPSDAIPQEVNISGPQNWVQNVDVGIAGESFQLLQIFANSFGVFSIVNLAVYYEIPLTPCAFVCGANLQL